LMWVKGILGGDFPKVIYIDGPINGTMPSENTIFR